MAQLQEFEQFLKRSNLSANTIESYLWTVEWFTGHYGEVNEKNLLEYKGFLVENFKPKTVNLRIQGMNKYLAFIGQELLQLNRFITNAACYLSNGIRTYTSLAINIP